MTLIDRTDSGEEIKGIIESAMNSFAEQFPGILIRSQNIEGFLKTVTGKEFVRIKFRIWPGRGSAIETSFKQELVERLKMVDPAYSDLMITVNYEVEKDNLK